MANEKRSSNSFAGGLNLDFDLLTVDNQSYVRSENGRILFADQASLSWTNAKGNVLAITITSTVAGTYTPIGYTVLNNLLILFLVNAVGDSEIGLVTFDNAGIQNAYKTLINDNAFADKLDFTTFNQIEARAVYENEKMHRVYWVDGVETDSNPPRAYTFQFNGGNINLATNYSGVTTTPHSIDMQAEFLMGIIKYKQMITGALPAGEYVYTYRLITVDGYATPWYPATKPLFVTQDPINPTNWNEYEMEGTETFVNTGKGNRLTIKGIDTRYPTIEVAYARYIANADPYEANIFLRTVVTGTEMDVDHTSNTGEPISPLELSAITISFTGVKTLNVKDNVLYYGNVRERSISLTAEEQEELFENLEIQPKFRLMRSDEKVLTDYTAPVPADEDATFPEKPITHQDPKTGLSTKRLNQLHTEDYVVNNDYINYKGTQVSHQYAGFFRGETYRLGFVPFDLVGNPDFAYHLADVIFGEQYEDGITWTRLKADGTTVSGNYTYAEFFRTTSNGTEGEDPILNGETGVDALARLRILGLSISGLNITSIKSRISGFKIVVAKRDAQILGQGLIMPCVKEEDYTTPLPVPTQSWVSTSGIVPIPLAEAGGDIRLLAPKQSESFYHLEKDNSPNTDEEFRVRPNTSTFYMPDVDFDSSRIPTPQPVDRLKLVGHCTQKDFDNDDQPRYRQWMHYNNYVVQKLDTTDGNYHYTSDNPYPNFGNDAEIEDLRVVNFGGTIDGKVENYAGTLDFINSVGIKAGQGANFEPHTFYTVENINGKSDLFGHGKEKTLFIFHTNFGVAANAFAYDSRAAYGLANYFICNYKRPNASPYGGITPISIEQTRFMTTGHFQPVNNPAIPCPDTVNDIEVFGGDCYLDYHGFLRIYGIMLLNTYQDNDAYSDYGIGHLFPLESSIHHSLRQATNAGGDAANPMWPDVGARPAKVLYGDDTTSTWVQNGLFLSWQYENKDYGSTEVSESFIEEFNIAGVLFLQAVLRIYAGRFSQVLNISHYPVRWRYSDVKFYGELVDRFRTFFANDFKDLNGVYGQITSSQYIFDQIYSFQMKAFGRLRAFDRALMESQNLGTLTTGIGSKLDGIDYISNINGNQHQWSLISSGKALYWIDVNYRSICRFAQDGFIVISDQRNVHAWANANLPLFEHSDNPVGGRGIFSTFDFDNDEVIFTLVDANRLLKFDTKHLIFNESTNKFIDTPTFNARFGLSFNDGVYYFNDRPGFGNQFWRHAVGPYGSYYGTTEDSLVTIVVNEIPYLAKVFDNIRANINNFGAAGLVQIVMETQEQIYTIPIVGDTRFKYLEQVVRGPLRTIAQNDRMRGKWIKLTFVFTNTPNQKIIFTNLMTLLRPSNRM
jgi:hypothetical protein